jgi:hypothetical protein
MSEFWYYAEGDETRGPIAFDQLIKILSQQPTSRGVLVWREGFADWTAAGNVCEIVEKLIRPPPLRPRSSETASAAGQLDNPADGVDDTVARYNPVQVAPEHTHGPHSTNAPSAAANWSLWKSANIGLVLSAFMLLFQIAGGQGFELANFAHTPNAGTMGALAGQILGLPLIFLLIAVVRNLLNRRQLKSSASAVRGALTFVALLASILGALMVYAEVFFSSTEIISGEARKEFIANAARSCAQKQRSLSQNIAEAQIEKYCTCMSEKFADRTTYKQIGIGLNESALADLKQWAESAGSACR